MLLIGSGRFSGTNDLQFSKNRKISFNRKSILQVNTSEGKK